MASTGFVSSDDPQEQQQRGGGGGGASGNGRGREGTVSGPFHWKTNSDANSTSSHYTSTPKNEAEAHFSFRQQAIDKAHEISAVDWHEHVEHHHENLHRHQSAMPKSGDGRRNSSSGSNSSKPRTSHHHISGHSTLRRRRRVGSVVSMSSIEGGGAAVGSKEDEEDKEGEGKQSEQFATAMKITSQEELESGIVNKKTNDDVQQGRSKPVPVGEGRGTQLLSQWGVYYTRHLQLLVSLAFFSYVGEYVRYILEFLFGDACHHPDEYQLFGEVFRRWNICTTDSGSGSGTGGAFFVDLPINILGCFLMGLFVSGDGESIAINLPMAALPQAHWGQQWVVTQVGIRTGLCGALTTFASWNTQLVIMLCNNTGTDLTYSQWMSAVWGYIVGLYASLQSYQLGMAVAYALSRFFNPQLAVEADKITDKKAIGVLINRDLPDFERRFLHSIVLNEDEVEKEKQEWKKEEEEEEENNNKNKDKKNGSGSSSSTRRKENLPKYCDTHKEYYNDHGSSGTRRKENLQKYGDTHKEYYNEYIHHLRAWKKSTQEHRCGKKKGKNNSTNNHNTSTNNNNNNNPGDTTTMDLDSTLPLSPTASSSSSLPSPSSDSPATGVVEDNYGGYVVSDVDDDNANTEESENYVHELQEIEKNLLVDKCEPRQELLDIARDAGWDVGALRNWTSALDHEEKKRIMVESGESVVAADADATNSNTNGSLDLEKDVEGAYFNASGTTTAHTSAVLLWEAAVNLVLFVLCTGLLLYGLLVTKDKTDVVSTKSFAQFLSALLAPLGTYSRWYLSRFNGSITTKHWEWLPIGTFVANMLASIISALCAALLLTVPKENYLGHAFLSAIKGGYAGSFSTVSTFVAETTGLLNALPRYFWGYYYCFGSLLVAVLLGVCSYVWAVV